MSPRRRRRARRRRARPGGRPRAAAGRRGTRARSRHGERSAREDRASRIIRPHETVLRQNRPDDRARPLPAGGRAPDAQPARRAAASGVGHERPRRTRQAGVRKTLRRMPRHHRARRRPRVAVAATPHPRDFSAGKSAIRSTETARRRQTTTCCDRSARACTDRRCRPGRRCCPTRRSRTSSSTSRRSRRGSRPSSRPVALGSQGAEPARQHPARAAGVDGRSAPAVTDVTAGAPAPSPAISGTTGTSR